MTPCVLLVRTLRLGLLPVKHVQVDVMITTVYRQRPVMRAIWVHTQQRSRRRAHLVRLDRLMSTLTRLQHASYVLTAHRVQSRLQYASDVHLGALI